MNRSALLACAAALAVLPPAWAADPKTNFMDHSNDTLIDAAAAKAVMDENIPAKVWKLYPARKYTFLSQVEGGITANKTCVVSARVMLLPLTATVGAVLMRPQKTATAFDAQPNSSTEQCRALARDKLKEATGAVVSALVKT
jgi:hypothetical protein